MVRAAAARQSSIAGDRPPHYGSPHIPPLTVGRGPVPRHRWAMRGTGPRATVCWWRFFDAVRDLAIPNYRLGASPL